MVGFLLLLVVVIRVCSTSLIKKSVLLLVAFSSYHSYRIATMGLN
jgi:hypothetical protein